MTKGFALREMFRKRRAIDRDKRPVGPFALAVDRARYQLFAGSTFTFNEDRRVASRNFRNNAGASTMAGLSPRSSGLASGGCSKFSIWRLCYRWSSAAKSCGMSRASKCRVFRDFYRGFSEFFSCFRTARSRQLSNRLVAEDFAEMTRAIVSALWHWRFAGDFPLLNKEARSTMKRSRKAQLLHVRRTLTGTG